jgi:SAM-dependent methyltransferase
MNDEIGDGHKVQRAMTTSLSFSLTEARDQVFRLKMGPSGAGGWSPRLRQRFGYFTPDEWYEAVLFHLIDRNTEWLDVGSGRELFPFNKKLGDVLSSRCKILVGIDPDCSINDNRALHERRQCLIEEYDTERQFDIVSLRMVAEHITDPTAAVFKLGGLTRTGGRVIVYTVSKWSPASLVAAVTPMAIHHAVKQVLWGALPEDTFPTIYRMNTRKELAKLFSAAGFAEEKFFYLNDCSSLGKWRVTTVTELAVERVLRSLGVRYPETCLLGVYQKH